MGSKNYELLVKTHNLYPPEFIVKYGTWSKHWELENWQRRERSLCHDMLCVLLANLTPSETIEEMMISKLKRHSDQNLKMSTKRRKLDDTNTFIYPENSDSESEDDDIMQNLQIDDNDEEYDPNKEFEKDHEHLFKYRYIVLEGLNNASEIQNHFVQKWKLIPKSKLFDIIDTKERKFIEVKTTINLVNILKEYSEHADTNIDTALVTIEMNECEITEHGKNDEMPGKSKALNFLLNRKAIMKTLNIEDSIQNEDNLEKIIFKSEYLNNTIDMMNLMFMKNIQEDININEINVEGFKIEHINPEKVFNLLRKPLLETHEETCVFKGKITPFFMCNVTKLEEETDLIAVDKFFIKIEGEKKLLQGSAELLKAVDELSDLWFGCQNKSKNFNFCNLRDKGINEKLSNEVKDSLGIDKKMKIFSLNIENPHQKEREPISQKNYPEWFEPLYEKLSQKSVIGSSNPVLIETKSKVSLYNHIQLWLESFYKEVSSRNIGVYMNQISNFYSRISGTYNTTIGKRTTHSGIAALPIKIVTHEKGELVRYMTGVAIRGPHHMRSATDKSNLLIIEEIKDSYKIPDNFYKNPTIFIVNGKRFMVRKTAIMKIDGIHLTFIDNSLFIASNMIGDILMRHQNFISEDAFKHLCSSHLTNEKSLNFFVDRVIDATLMAVLGNGRDEGYFSMFRKFFMIFLNVRRQQNSFTFDVNGLCKKMNECIIDNPFSMFFHNSLLYMICNLY